MKKLFFTFFLSLLCLSMSAQTLMGDMNDDGEITASDITASVSTALGQTAKRYVNPYQATNTAIVGTWYKSKTESITFSQDGTTSLGSGYTYKYRPNIGKVSVYNASGVSVADYEVFDLSSSVLEMGLCGSSSHSFYTSTPPVQLVTGITLNVTTLSLEENDNYTLSATVTPTDADNRSVTWSSSNADVATVSTSGKVMAVGVGTATITCTAADGSGVKATCTVTVSKAADAHEYVDLDLPSGTKWATCNVGADSPEDYGDYFAWGETTGYDDGKTTFSWSNLKYCSGTTYEGPFTKYCTSSSYGTVDNKTELDVADDAAYVNWGSDWRMPSYDQIQELINSSYTTTTWTTQNGVYGRKITSNTNRDSIFLPAAGYPYDSSLYDAGSLGYYWSRSLYSIYPGSACSLYFNSSGISWSYDDRFQGRSVRPVRASE